MTLKVYTKDVPDQYTIADYLKANTDFVERMDSCVPSRRYPEIIEFDGGWIDYPALQLCVSDGFKRFGQYGWLNQQDDGQNYTGVSLVYNPDHQDSMDVHRSTLGTQKIATEKFFWNAHESHKVFKNSYFDTYGFRFRTPFANTGYLKEVIDAFNLTMVRSRISTVHAIYHNPQKIDKKWHKDERVFENIRINIPVTSAPEFVFELDGHDPIHLEVGKMYSWDTHIAHGVYETRSSKNSRTHIVLGFSPWWSYNPEEDYWFKNEFYGKHPFDMYYDGDICKHLQMTDGF
jgi:hypothetical protein